MHEMSLCEGLFENFKDAAVRHNFQKITKVRLEIGALASVDPSALRFAFNVVQKGTLADNAELVIEIEKALAWCFDCSQNVEISTRLDSCPQCGGQKITPVSGTEMKLKDMEVV